MKNNVDRIDHSSRYEYLANKTVVVLKRVTGIKYLDIRLYVTCDFPRRIRRNKIIC